jgi:peptidoglycan/xylan/chitin deacetylase (PgdA/CDA1 family)
VTKPWGNISQSNEYAYEFLDEQQILDLHNKGFEIYPHSHTHSDLTQMDPISQKRDIDESTIALEALLNIKPVSFAYPFGKYDTSIVELLFQRGYTSAFSTKEGLNSPGDNLFTLRRNSLSGEVDADTLRLSLTGKIRLYKYFSSLFHRLIP